MKTAHYYDHMYMYNEAVKITQTADIFVVIGTSLAVYPAAMLVRYVPSHVPIFVVDPGQPDMSIIRNPVTFIQKRAAIGVPELAELLKEKYR